MMAESGPKQDSASSKPDKLEAGVDYPKVDRDDVPVEVSAGVQPDLKGGDLLAAAQVKAPNLTAEFVSKHKLPDEYLAAIARGEEPPPPYNGPDTSATDLHLTPGGWQNTPAGVPPEDVGKNAIARDR